MSLQAVPRPAPGPSCSLSWVQRTAAVSQPRCASAPELTREVETGVLVPGVNGHSTGEEDGLTQAKGFIELSGRWHGRVL